jgi:hypothetical protein
LHHVRALGEPLLIDFEITMKVIQHTGLGVAQKLFVFAVAAFMAGSAFAHVFPKTEEPAASAVVTSPAQVRIAFTGPLEPAFSSLTVTNAEGTQMTAVKAKVDPANMSVMSVGLPVLPAGHYTVHWVAVAPDGHRTQGQYPFDVK